MNNPEMITELAAHDAESQPTVKQPKPYARPQAEILADLSKPIAPQHLRYKVKGGQTLPFINWHTACDYLDYFAPGWCYEIRRIDHVAGKVVVTARITIPTAEGLIWREATGNEDDDVETWGDPTSNAESMALRRAAAKFGLARYLYKQPGHSEHKPVARGSGQ